MFPSLPLRAVVLPSPASWATCTTWRSVGRRSLSWRRCCSIVPTVGKPTSPRPVWSTTWNQSMLLWVRPKRLFSLQMTKLHRHTQKFNYVDWVSLDWIALSPRCPRKTRKTRHWRPRGRPTRRGRPAAGCSERRPRWQTSTWLRLPTTSCPKIGPRGSFSQTWCLMTKRQEEVQSVLNVDVEMLNVHWPRLLRAVLPSWNTPDRVCRPSAKRCWGSGRMRWSCRGKSSVPTR